MRAKYIAIIALLLSLNMIIVSAIIPRPVEAGDSESLPHAVIIGEDRSPYYVKVRVKGIFKSLKDVEEYIDARKRVLQSLAREARDIEVWVSFRELRVEDVVYMLREYGFKEVTEIQVRGVDRRGNYLFTAGLDLTGKGAINLDTFTKELEEFLRRVPSAPPHQQLLVNYVRGKMPADKSLGLQEDARVILVDPITDIERRFAGRALFVFIESMPQVDFYIEYFSRGG